MLALLLATMRCLAYEADTSLVLAFRELDVTGDGRAEVIEVLGRPESRDSMEIRFVIRTPDRVPYEAPIAPLTRTVGFDAGSRAVTEEEYRERLDGLGAAILDDAKFRTATEFEAWLTRSAPGRVPVIPEVIARSSEGRVTAERGAGIWAELRRREGIVFEFSPGGDRIEAIAWSEADERFYRLIECC